ncbi:MAG TPA: hypothetical protein VM581_04280 [Magnetospirillaceae bacterium]|nr:hypothetical protein [Magnetospirillaceae bacterium]
MDDILARDLAAMALKILKPLATTSKNIEAHFQPSEHYSDSFISGKRKGGLFGAKPEDPFTWLSINITLRPGIVREGWVGFTLDIDNPESNPHISLAREWPQEGGEVEASPNDANALRKHIAALVETPLTADNRAAPREAPASMF